jgi:hypothetical protein
MSDVQVGKLRIRCFQCGNSEVADPINVPKCSNCGNENVYIQPHTPSPTTVPLNLPDRRSALALEIAEMIEKDLEGWDDTERCVVICASKAHAAALRALAGGQVA